MRLPPTLSNVYNHPNSQSSISPKFTHDSLYFHITSVHTTTTAIMDSKQIKQQEKAIAKEAKTDNKQLKSAQKSFEKEKKKDAKLLKAHAKAEKEHQKAIAVRIYYLRVEFVCLYRSRSIHADKPNISRFRVSRRSTSSRLSSTRRKPSTTSLSVPSRRRR